MSFKAYLKGEHYYRGDAHDKLMVTKGSKQQLHGIKLISVHGRYKKLNNKRKRKQ